MPGPQSLPDGNKKRYEELNEVVCDIHYNCEMLGWQKHEYITYREWLARRNRLRTGKTL